MEDNTAMNEGIVETQIEQGSENPSNDSQCEVDIAVSSGSNKTQFIKRKVKGRTNSPKESSPSKKIKKKQRIRAGETIDKMSKKAHAEGKAGIGRKGPFKAREMKSCSDSCRYVCKRKISDDDRLKAFNAFWALADKRNQWQCINNWVTLKKSNGNTSDEELGIQHKLYHDFRLPSADGYVSVCQTMFTKTLDISYQWIRTAKKKQSESDCTGIISKDMRGKHDNRPFKYPEELKNKARDHMRSFLSTNSQDFPESDQKKNLEGQSLASMYRMYVKEVGTGVDDSLLLSYNMYSKIFNDEFSNPFVKT